MLFHVTITHSQADCPGRRPGETPDLIGPTERLEALGDELSVTSHSLVWGAACILWAEPEHVAYALLEASSLDAVEGYVDTLIPAGWERRVQPVFTMPTQLETVRQLLSQPVMPQVQPLVAAVEADTADTVTGLTIAQPPDEPSETAPEPLEEERADQQITPAVPTPVFGQPVVPVEDPAEQQVTRAIPTPVFGQPVVPAEEPAEQQVTRAIPTPVFDQPVAPAAELPDQQVTRAIPTPVFDQPVAPAAEPTDQQVTRAIPTPVFDQPVAPAAEPPDKSVTREIPRPVEQPAAPADRGSSAVTRFIERPAILDSRAGAAPRPDQPSSPAPSVTPREPLPSSESTTVILGSAAQRSVGIQLVAKTGPAQGSVFDVGEAGATLGRLPDNSICLTDGRLSRHHAQIEYRDGAYWLSDLGSQNGTLLNDRPLTEAHRLQAGDSIELGTTRLTVMLEPND